MREPPSDIERAVYSGFNKLHGESDEGIIYDDPKAPLPRVLVQVWRGRRRWLTRTPTRFATVGVSTKPMPGSNERRELELLARCDQTDERGLAALLANLACYPFEHGLELKENELVLVGSIPRFPSCDGIALFRGIDGAAVDHVHFRGEAIGVLTAVPVTANERELLRTSGLAGLEAEWQRRSVDRYVDRAS